MPTPPRRGTTPRQSPRQVLESLGYAPDAVSTVAGPRSGGTGPRPASDALTTLLQPHPRYTEWLETWRWLGWSYEGDGPYLDGTALIPHPREVLLGETDGRLDIKKPLGMSQKFVRRQALARYDNLAQPLVDTVADYLFNTEPERTGTGSTFTRFRDWLKDVDGLGTPINDWLKDTATLAFVYGYVLTTLERAAGTTPAPKTAAEEGRLVLRVYTPPDLLDWVWSQSAGLKAVKLLESVPRETVAAPFTTTIGQQAQLATMGSQELTEGASVKVRVWTGTGLTEFDATTAAGLTTPTNYGRPPALFYYHRRRRRIPVIGASMMGDPRMYRDHYNLVSELRELLRSQTFSMLAVGLGDGEQLGEARARLGERAATDTIIWHRGGAAYIAPPEGPVAQYADTIEKLERKIFRRVGLAWDSGDTYAPEAEGSRRIKAMDLNRILAGQADESQRFEQALARLWCIADANNAERGNAAYDAMQYAANYPDEFYVASAVEKMQEIAEADSITFGPTLAALQRKQAVPLLLRNVDPATRAVIDREIDEAVQQKAEDERALAEAGLTATQAEAQGAAASAAAAAAESESGLTEETPAPKTDAGD